MLHMLSSIMRRLLVVLLFGIVIGLGTHRLSESPTIWGDEGMILELAANLVRHGTIQIQVAPQTFISAAFTTTGFPVIYPVAASYTLFGINLLNARIIMVFYMLLCVGAFFLVGKRVVGTKPALFSAFLVATFAPFYGNGKNVLGEVPGLFFLCTFLLCIHRIETSKEKRWAFALLAGLTAGLCLVTKPIFLLLFPAILGAAIILRKKPDQPLVQTPLFLLGLAIPLLIWIKTQFLPSDSLRDILSFYSNPYQLDDVRSVIVQNILRFTKELAPLYLLGLFGLWSASFLWRLWNDLRKNRQPSDRIERVEAICYVFVALVLVAYLRTPGWYRYFFPAQIIVFLFAPSSLLFLCARLKGWMRYLPSVALIGLILFQTYQVTFKSWIAVSYYSTFTQELIAHFKTVDPNKTIFLHTVPELIVFLPTDKYYQYIELNDQKIGLEQLTALEQGAPDLLIMYDRRWDDIRSQFPLYVEKTRVARYVFAERVQR
jgi:4-amino-4-deoxy-L-arabinose transferase-like glycosyltransferase